MYSDHCKEWQREHNNCIGCLSEELCRKAMSEKLLVALSKFDSLKDEVKRHYIK